MQVMCEYNCPHIGNMFAPQAYRGLFVAVLTLTDI